MKQKNTLHKLYWALIYADYLDERMALHFDTLFNDLLTK